MAQSSKTTKVKKLIVMCYGLLLAKSLLPSPTSQTSLERSAEMLKKNDRVFWLGEDMYIKTSKFLSKYEIVTITEISPCGELCFVQTKSGAEYGWLKVERLGLASPFIIPIFNNIQACA